MIEINKLTIDEYYKLLDSVNWKRPSERLLKWLDEIGQWVVSNGVKFSV